MSETKDLVVSCARRNEILRYAQNDMGVKAVSVSQMREIDRLTIEVCGIPGVALMENAGRAVADVVKDKPDVLVFCGSGNNGGDGLVSARYLHNRGCKVTIVLAGSPERFSRDALTNWKIVQYMKLRWLTYRAENLKRIRRLLTADCIFIDALLGTGAKNWLQFPYDELVALINAANKKVISVDIPSGLNGDTGEAMPTAVKATVTVTMGLAKTGLLKPQAKQYAGNIVIADIGIPGEIPEYICKRRF